MEEALYGGLFAASIFVGVLGFIFAVVAYVFSALGLMTLANNKGIENAWLAWIPIANLYILGKIVETVDIGTWTVPKLELILPLSVPALWLLNFIPVIGWLASIAVLVFYGFVLHKLFSKYRPEQAVLYTVLSIVLGLFWIFIFIIRNDTEVA